VGVRVLDTTTAKKAALTMPPLQFLDDWLFGAAPHAFTCYEDSYSAFCRELATSLGVHPADVALVGSGRLGFSLNPQHLLSRFSGTSDLDVVVVSSSVFDGAWTDLLHGSVSTAFAETEERRRLRKTQDNFFDGYLRSDHVPVGSALSREWFPKLAGPFSSVTARRHEVKAWLFKSWWHAELFYLRNVSAVRPALQKLMAGHKESP